MEEEGKIAFLDTCVHLQDDGGLKTTVYRKPTLTDQYLNWDSNYPLEHKRSVIRTLINRSGTHITDTSDQLKEIQHVKEVLGTNGYPDWSLEVPNQSDKVKRKERKEITSTTPNSTPSIGLPYITGLSEELQRVFRDHGVAIYHKPTNTLRSLLVKPKEK